MLRVFHRRRLFSPIEGVRRCWRAEGSAISSLGNADGRYPSGSDVVRGRQHTPPCIRTQAYLSFLPAMCLIINAFNSCSASKPSGTIYHEGGPAADVLCRCSACQLPRAEGYEALLTGAMKDFQCRFFFTNKAPYCHRDLGHRSISTTYSKRPVRRMVGAGICFCREKRAPESRIISGDALRRNLRYPRSMVMERPPWLRSKQSRRRT